MKTTDKSYSAPELVAAGRVIARTLGFAVINRTEPDGTSELPYQKTVEI